MAGLEVFEQVASPSLSPLRLLLPFMWKDDTHELVVLANRLIFHFLRQQTTRRGEDQFDGVEEEDDIELNSSLECRHPSTEPDWDLAISWQLSFVTVCTIGINRRVQWNTVLLFFVRAVCVCVIVALEIEKI